MKEKEYNNISPSQSEQENLKLDFELLLENTREYLNENEIMKLRSRFYAILNDFKERSFHDLSVRFYLSLFAANTINELKSGYLPLLTTLVYDLKDEIGGGDLGSLLDKEEVQFVLDVCEMEKIEYEVPWRNLGKVIKFDNKIVFDRLRERTIYDNSAEVKYPFLQRLSAQQENLLRLFLSLSKNFGVLYVKLCDRIAILKFMEKLSPTKTQKEILANETMKLHVPIAERLGIWNFKWQLEDLAFRELQPYEYTRITDFLSTTRVKREEIIEKIISYLQKLFYENNIKATITGRPKHIFSIFKKQQKLGLDVARLNDLLGVRCLVETVEDCYAVFNILHSNGLVINGIYEEDKIMRDWIAHPKLNEYRSIHTTIMLEKLDPFLSSQLIEVQIRTYQMHEVAESGVAAHWRYKQKIRDSKRTDKKTLEWTTEQKKLRDELKLEEKDFPFLSRYFGDYTFVISPEGEIFSMTKESIPIDFAYRIHMDVGNHCVGAKVNGKLVDLLKYELKNGDVIEILTSQKQKGPKVEWLHHVKTELAKKNIRHQLKKLQNHS